MARGLRFSGCYAYFLPDQAIEQGGFAHIRAAHNGNQPAPVILFGFMIETGDVIVGHQEFLKGWTVCIIDLGPTRRVLWGNSDAAADTLAWLLPARRRAGTFLHPECVYRALKSRIRPRIAADGALPLCRQPNNGAGAAGGSASIPGGVTWDLYPGYGRRVRSAGAYKALR